MSKQMEEEQQKEEQEIPQAELTKLKLQLQHTHTPNTHTHIKKSILYGELRANLRRITCELRGRTVCDSV